MKGHALQPQGVKTSWIVTPVMLGLAVSWLAILGLTYSATMEMDANDLQRETRLARSSTGLIGDTIAAQAADYTWWNDAIENLVLTTDSDWAADNIGSYQYDSFGFTGAYVLSGDGRTLIAFEDGEQTDADVLARFPQGLDTLIARARAAAVDKPIPAVGLLHVNGQLHSVAASAFMQENPGDGLDLPDPRPLLIFSRQIDEDLLAEYADILQLPGLRLSQERPQVASVALNAPDGTVLGYLTWDFQPSGNLFLQQVSLPILFAIVFTALFAYLFVQRARQIVRAQHDLRVANTAKSQFLANMSHEFRTPLWAIIGFSSSMKNGLFGPIENEKYQDYVNDIQQSGQHLLDLINDILDVSAIEAGTLKLREEPLDMAEVVEATVRLVRPNADEKRLTIETEIAAGFPTVYADKRRAKQAVLNLLSNAVKFSLEGGTITVSAALNRNGQPCITVSDVGIGMSEDEIQTSLKPFGQVDGGFDRKSDGTGLGLPLTLGLMERHGGTLNIESAPGRGAQVTLVFPKERVGAVEPPLSAPTDDARQAARHARG